MTNEISNMRKQMLENRIKTVAYNLGISNDEAFMHVAYALIFNTDNDTPDYDVDVIDGSGDKQIDIIKVESFNDQATIHLIQIKNNNKYEGTVVVQMRDALSWVFERPPDQYEKLSNEALVQKISEIRDILSDMTPKNIEVAIHYVAKGNTDRLSPDFIQEIRSTESLYNGSKDFLKFSFNIWGVDELIARSNEIKQENRRIDVNMPIYNIWNVPSYLKYSTADMDAAVCIVEGKELAKIVEQHGESLFEENVRTFLGDKKVTNKKSVNKDILKTCSDDKEADFFGFIIMVSQ